MRAFAVVAAVAALAVAVAASSSGAATQASALRVTDLRPLALTGTGFRPNERVTIVLLRPDYVRGRIRANNRGRFVFYIAGTVVGRCHRVVARARGSAGSRVTLRRALPRGCNR